MDDLLFKPLSYSYRVDKNIWAGEYPVRNWDRDLKIKQLKFLTDFGINSFLDLTTEGEMPPYSTCLNNDIIRYSLPIVNRGIPKSVESVVEIFRTIEDLLIRKPETKLYIHCVGGVGRTGTIVSCYFVYFKHMNANDALAEMQRRYLTHQRSRWISAPETELQVQFVNDFADKVLNVTDIIY
ncbi:MAG: dual specificity protein phosphatase family protein [Bacteroidales bacterium]|nr:dual specificity protein phosphatase family protein [Bacteroidales bacterium]